MADLNKALKEAMQVYAGSGSKCYVYPLFDDDNQTYGLNLVDFLAKRPRAGIVFFARIMGDKIIIEEDLSDKPLYEALLEQGITREQVILVYAGEPYPASELAQHADALS